MKAGFFAFILKFLKFILIGLAAAGAYIFKFFKKKKEEKAALAYAPASTEGEPNALINKSTHKKAVSLHCFF